MRSDPDHSFVVLAYEDSPHLEECIQSLLHQTLRSDVLLCTSTPSAFLERTAIRFGVRLCVNARREGIAADWNFGYAQAATPYVTLAHQDDLYLPGYAEACMEAARRDRENLIVFTNYRELLGTRVRNTSSTLAVKRMILSLFFIAGEGIRSPFFKKRLLCLGSPVPCPTVMYHKRKIGEFQFSSDYSINLDWDAWLSLAGRQGGFTYVKENLLLHRIHAGSETVRGIADERRRREDEALFEQLWPRPVAGILSRIYKLSYLSNRG